MAQETVIVPVKLAKNQKSIVANKMRIAVTGEIRTVPTGLAVPVGRFELILSAEGEGNITERALNTLS
jgi:hypothetical protein